MKTVRRYRLTLARQWATCRTGTVQVAQVFLPIRTGTGTCESVARATADGCVFYRPAATISCYLLAVLYLAPYGTELSY